MNFEFATAGRILFGRGRIGEAGALAAARRKSTQWPTATPAAAPRKP